MQRAAFRAIIEVWYKWDKSLHEHISISQAEMPAVILTLTPSVKSKTTINERVITPSLKKNLVDLVCNTDLALVKLQQGFGDRDCKFSKKIKA